MRLPVGARVKTRIFSCQPRRRSVLPTPVPRVAGRGRARNRTRGIRARAHRPQSGPRRQGPLPVPPRPHPFAARLPRPRPRLDLLQLPLRTQGPAKRRRHLRPSRAALEPCHPRPRLPRTAATPPPTLPLRPANPARQRCRKPKAAPSHLEERWRVSDFLCRRFSRVGGLRSGYECPVRLSSGSGSRPRRDCVVDGEVDERSGCLLVGEVSFVLIALRSWR
jgi:hypothetical protein